MKAGVCKEVSAAFFQMIFEQTNENEEIRQSAIDLLAESMEKISEGKLPKRLISWIM